MDGCKFADYQWNTSHSSKLCFCVWRTGSGRPRVTGSGRHGQEGENAGRIGRYGRKNGNGRTGEKEGGQGYSCSKEVRKKDGTSVQQLKKNLWYFGYLVICAQVQVWGPGLRQYLFITSADPDPDPAAVLRPLWQTDSVIVVIPPINMTSEPETLYLPRPLNLQLWPFTSTKVLYLSSGRMS